jgi:hypothetical protein
VIIPRPVRVPPESQEGDVTTRARRARRGVEANARLTASTAVVLLVLLAVEGVTILRVGRMLWLHVFIGVMLILPVVLKINSTGYRLTKYYLGAPAYREKGPPPWLLRLLGPLVIVSTLTVLGSGVGLLFSSGTLRQQLLLPHRASFIIWFGVMVLHVLGHIGDTARLVPLDLYRSTRRQVVGAGTSSVGPCCSTRWRVHARQHARRAVDALLRPRLLSALNANGVGG